MHDQMHSSMKEQNHYACTTTSFDPFQHLPDELCLMILECLDPTSLAAVCKVSRHWSDIASTDALWKKFYRWEPWYTAQYSAITETQTGLTPTTSYRPKTSWKSTFASRRYLENNWEVGKYTTFTLNAGFKVSCIRLHGRHLFTGDITGTILRWNLDSRTLIAAPLFTPDRSEVRCIELDPVDPESTLLCGYRSGALAVWHIPSRRILQWRSHAHSKAIDTLRLSGRLIVTGSADNTIKVWARPTGSNDCAWTGPLELTWTLTGHTAFVSALHLSADLDTDTHTLTSSSPGDCMLNTWNLRTGRCTASYMRPGAIAYGHLDGQRVCVGRRIKLWDERAARTVSTVLDEAEGVTLAAQGIWRGGELKRVVMVGTAGCVVWECKERVGEKHGEWEVLHRLVNGEGLQRPEGVTQPKPQILRHCQVDERRIVCYSEARVLIWDFK